MKESQIQSQVLKYLHRLISHSLFGRKEANLVVLTIELTILYCMVHDQKVDICHALVRKFRDVVTKTSGAIKIGGFVTTIASYLGFDMENIPFEKVKGHSLIGINMMKAMGSIRKDHRGKPILNRHVTPPNVQPQVEPEVEEEEEEQDIDLNNVMQRLDDLELQVGGMDSNVVDPNDELHNA